MKAEEARKITENSLQGDAIKPLLEVVYERINVLAKAGKRSLPFPFNGAKINPYPHKAIIDAAIHHLKMDGYSATYHNYIDSSDPRETSYWEISW